METFRIRWDKQTTGRILMTVAHSTQKRKGATLTEQSYTAHADMGERGDKK
jgi:hypothetical protein